MRMSILLRLTLWNSSVLALILVAFAATGWFTFSRAVQQRTSAVVRESARAVAGAIMAERRAAAARGEVEAVRGEHEQAVLRELRVGDLDIFITDESAQLMAVRQPRAESLRVRSESPRDPEETPLAEAPTGDVSVPPAVRALMATVRADRDAGRLSDSSVVVREVQLDNGPARAAMLRVEPDAADAGEPALLITALRSEREDIQLLGQVRTTLLLGVPLALLVSLVAGYLLARRSLAPLEAINARTASISAANLSDRLPVVNPHDELGTLAGIINGLLSRVDSAFRAQKQFVADASHELRTPLAIIRGEADVTLRRATRSEAEYREAMQVIHGESVRLTRIVDDLFLLARVDAGAAEFTREPVSLPEIMADAVRSVRSLAEARQVQLRCGMSSQASATLTMVAGDRVLLHRLLLNLLDNAIKHAPAGSVVTVELAPSAVNGMLSLRVHDMGPGIPAVQRARIFERFVHGVHAASPVAGTGSGAGLGLAIAQAIAHAHGGRIVLVEPPTEQLPAGPVGATFDVILPLLPAAGATP